MFIILLNKADVKQLSAVKIIQRFEVFMGKNLQKLYSFRTNEDIIKKIEYIADLNTRNRNQQIEHLLKECINDFELKNGQLVMEEDGSISISKPKVVGKSDKLSNSKSG